jgi:hypothetical protein
MVDDFLCNRRAEACEPVLKRVRKPEVLELFDMDEEDEEFFLQVILEELQEHRKQLGILGWWPIYETNERLQADPEFARRFLIAFAAVTAVGVAAFAAFVLPHLPWIGPRIERFFAACWAIIGW